MKDQIFKNRIFIILYLIFFISIGFILIIYSKKDIHLAINHYHCIFFDKFFIFVTFLGSGVTAIVLSLIMLFIRYRFAIFIFLSYAISGIVVQLIKNFLFPHVPRPYEFFVNGNGLYLIPGISMNTFMSFPSGHSATAFAVFYCLSVIYNLKNKNLMNLIFFISALLISFSRVYLSQHFLIDIYFDL